MKSQPDLKINPIFFPDLKFNNHSQLNTNSRVAKHHNKLIINMTVNIIIFPSYF